MAGRRLTAHNCICGIAGRRGTHWLSASFSSPIISAGWWALLPYSLNLLPQGWDRSTRQAWPFCYSACPSSEREDRPYSRRRCWTGTPDSGPSTAGGAPRCSASLFIVLGLLDLRGPPARSRHHDSSNVWTQPASRAPFTGPAGPRQTDSFTNWPLHGRDAVQPALIYRNAGYSGTIIL